MDRFAHDVRPLVRRLRKPPEEWLRDDLVSVIREDGIRVVNLRYPGFDGKLRELRVPVRDPGRAERVLAFGERVDGSSLFPGLFPASNGDLYVVPVYRWAFRNPWADDELDVVCRYAGPDGAPCPLTPDNVLAAAAERLRATTGATLRALAELELYLILERQDDRFTGIAQRNYHQSSPYLHGRALADEILRVVTEVTGCVKYCHAEVGYVDRIESDDPEIRGRRAEQYELELSLVPVEDLGTWISVARWLIRGIAARHGASATFLPKLEEGAAGSGMHLHLALERDGRNAMRDEGGDLSDEALRLIGGLMGEVHALTAFGNTVAASYLRLVPGQEAPTRVFWGRHDRSSLIRIPLDFRVPARMDQAMNPAETGALPDVASQATVEFRSPDGSAFAHLLLAAVTLCVQEGLTASDALQRARAMEVVRGESGARDAPGSAAPLPATAVEAAERLLERRGFFEERGFPPIWIDLVARKLRQEDDGELSARLAGLPAPRRQAELRRVMHKDLHKH
jgi:glutamine synthetase